MNTATYDNTTIGSGKERVLSDGDEPRPAAGAPGAAGARRCCALFFGAGRVQGVLRGHGGLRRRALLGAHVPGAGAAGAAAAARMGESLCDEQQN